MSGIQKRRWIAILGTLAVGSAIAVSQINLGGVIVNDPITRLQQMFGSLMNREIAAENALRQEIQEREKLTKEVDQLKKELEKLKPSPTNLKKG